MSDSPIFSKMDALLHKHRGGVDNPAPVQSESAGAPAAPASSRSAPPANAWLPVLTQVIERGTPPVVAAPAAAPDAAHLPETSSDTPAPEQPLNAAPQAAAAQLLDANMAEQLMRELAPRLSAVMEQQVASELRKNLDQTVATLLSQLDVNVREIVRDAVAEKLKKPRDPSL